VATEAHKGLLVTDFVQEMRTVAQLVVMGLVELAMAVVVEVVFMVVSVLIIAFRLLLIILFWCF
jgi:hypothetical protein